MSTDRHAARLKALEHIVAEVVEAQGLELVELHLKGSSQRRLLRVDIDRAGPLGVGLEDCKKVSDALGVALDREEDLTQGSYVLEVSSPGADRPIRTDDDVRRNNGRRVVAICAEPIEGLRELRGVLLGGRPGRVTVRLDDGREIEVPLSAALQVRQELGF